MRVLFVSEMVYGSRQGGTTLALSHLRLLKSLYGASSVDTCYINLEQVYDYANGEANEVIEATHAKLQRLSNVLSNRMYFLSKGAEDRIASIVIDGAYEVVWFDNAMCGGAAARIRDKCPTTAIVTFYQFNAVQRYFQIYLEKPSRLRLMYNCFGSIPQELQHLKASDVNYVLTSRDKQLFSSINNVHDCKLLPMMVEDILSDDLDKDTIIKSSDNMKVTLLFVGSTYWPNIEGVKWFVSNVIPRLGNKCVLEIVGRGLEVLRNDFASIDYVDVVGSCDNLAEKYCSADLVVAPILHGDGMKTKVAEALMYGRRVLGTTEALVGYEESTCILCDTPDDYVYEISRCIDCGDLGFRGDARADYENRYSLDALRLHVSSDIEQAIISRKDK